jgi:hypothetical protein
MRRNGSARTRWVPVTALAVVACVALLAIRGREKPAAAAPAVVEDGSRPPSATRPTGDHRAAPEGAAQPASMAPRSLGADEKRAQDRAVLDAVQRFQRDAMPALDACLGASPAPRVPHMVVITFRRDPADTTPGGERFVAADVHVPPQRAGTVEATSPVGRCLGRLEGRPLAVAAGNAPEGGEFKQVLTLFLPAPAAP